MSMKNFIRTRIEDADFLVANGRYESALLLLLTAIDGSAAKIFPKGYPSIDNPLPNRKGKVTDMSTKERYKRFLGVRLRQVLGHMLQDDAYFSKEITHRGDAFDKPVDMIYEVFRCNDVHEAHIPDELHYVYDPSATSNDMCITFNGDEIRFSKGFLSLLRKIVVDAPCNTREFGRITFSLKPIELSKNDLIEKLSEKHAISYPRIRLLLNLVELVGPESYEMNDEVLGFNMNKVLQEHFPGGALTALTQVQRFTPIWDMHNGITELGMSIVREALSLSKFEEIY
ncbi:hypothetical protein ACTV10_001468 [Cronobacter sakazakii]